MGHGDGAHTHGGGHPAGWIVPAVIFILGVTGSWAGVLAGLEDLVVWLAVVIVAALAVTVVLVIRSMRNRTPDYVPGVHGPSSYELAADHTRAMRAIREPIRDDRAADQEGWKMLAQPAENHYHLHVDREDLARYLSRNTGHEEV